MMRFDAYAPITYFEIVEQSLSSGVVRGFARPAGGKRPSGLALMAGSTVISTSAATDFSSEALQRGIRLGWCGFVIGGLGQALAVDDPVELRCLVSDKVQMRWDGAELATELGIRHRSHLSVSDMLAKIRDAGSCRDIEQVLPFALDLARKSGTRTFLEATFLYLLERLPDPGAIANFADNYSVAESTRRCWNDIMISPEYRQINKNGIMNPFDPGFPFSLDSLDL